MNTTEKIEALTNFLNNVNKNPKLFIKSDEINGKTFAIAEHLTGGTIATRSNFMTYDEMNCYFFGVLAVKENRIDFTTPKQVKISIRDFVQNYESIPEEVKSVLEHFKDMEALTHDKCREILLNLETIGYTFEFGLDAVPFNLKKI